MTPDPSTVSPEAEGQWKTGDIFYKDGKEYSQNIYDAAGNMLIEYCSIELAQRIVDDHNRALLPKPNTITRAQARKLVEQALRAQENPGEYTPQQMFGGQYEDNTQWKARALELVMSRMADEPPAIQMSAEAVEKVREALLWGVENLQGDKSALISALSILPATPRQAP